MSRPLVLMVLLTVSSASDGSLGHARTVTCTESPLLAELDSPSGKALLTLYGFDLGETWACTPIRSALAPRAQLLRFRRLSEATAEATAFTVLKTAGAQTLWIIPTATGMLRVAGVESDPHNIAAFNALLRSMPKPTSSTTDWEALARLYLAVVGHAEVFPLKTEGGAPATCGAQGECSLSFADRAPQAAHSYWKWTVTFDRLGKGPIRLTDATAELVSATQ
jgi:hypothetical protein